MSSSGQPKAIYWAPLKARSASWQPDQHARAEHGAPHDPSPPTTMLNWTTIWNRSKPRGPQAEGPRVQAARDPA